MNSSFTTVNNSNKLLGLLFLTQVTWTDVGGLESVKRQLREAVDLPFRAPDILSKLGVEPPRGKNISLAQESAFLVLTENHIYPQAYFCMDPQGAAKR